MPLHFFLAFRALNATLVLCAIKRLTHSTFSSVHLPSFSKTS